MKSEELTRLVILDDDPTGIQTVHGCLLITQWDAATVRIALLHEQPFFYMLTNPRAMTREEAAQVVRSAMETVLEVNRDLGYRLIVISRSDSCLRGHFPLETDVMRQVLREYGVKVWPKVPFCPARRSAFPPKAIIASLPITHAPKARWSSAGGRPSWRFHDKEPFLR